MSESNFQKLKIGVLGNKKATIRGVELTKSKLDEAVGSGEHDRKCFRDVEQIQIRKGPGSPCVVLFVLSVLINCPDSESRIERQTVKRTSSTSISLYGSRDGKFTLTPRWAGGKYSKPRAPQSAEYGTLFAGQP